MAWTESKRPEEPILDRDPKTDIHVFYHNLAYKVSRQAINIEKLSILEERLGDCVRREGVNYIEKCEELSLRFQAAARVCQRNVGPLSKRRNVGNVYEDQTTPAAVTGTEAIA